EIDAIADRAVWDVAMAGVQPLAFGTGAYRIGVNGEHTFENYLSVASPLIGPLAKYGARFVGSGLRSAGNSTSVVAERGAGKFVSQGFSPAQAEYLAEPYVGMGHHFIPRRAGLPSIISDSPLNVLKPSGISRGNFYELHFKVDPFYPGSRLPGAAGGGVWNGTSLGLEKYGTVGRLWFGSPTPLKVTVGGTVAAGGAAYWYSSDGK
ncbi:hypothetical protein, partial [Sphingorhabdus sp.]|uniref:hypothetical protein n=1 Tax=Sphingorhabdus sp. TaxID=1902408 RepID=UPI0037CADEE5